MRKLFVAGVVLLLLVSCSTVPSTYTSSVEVEAIRHGYYPYRVMRSVPIGWSQVGMASWYGAEFNGRRTASGEIYNMYNMTAAHRTLPFGTLVRVVNLNNGRSVVVKINDRGPFVKGRIIDLSYEAALRLGMIGTGTVPVRITVVGSGGRYVVKSSPRHHVYAVQVGAFTSQLKAMEFRDKLSEFLDDVYIRHAWIHGKLFYKVMVGSFFSKYAAEEFAERIVRPLVRNYFVSSVP